MMYQEKEVRTQVKERRKKDNHNAIERRRRYHINERITDLLTLLPSHEDMKPHKGEINHIFTPFECTESWNLRYDITIYGDRIPLTVEAAVTVTSKRSNKPYRIIINLCTAVYCYT